MGNECILSYSYGKDSSAAIYVIKELLGWPLDRIVTADIWATDTILADLPPMVEFKAQADETIKRRWGIEVEHFCAVDSQGEKITYEKIFYRRRVRSIKGNTINKMYGWPFQKGAWCNDRLKLAALQNLPNGAIHYLGIAFDEPSRVERHSRRPDIKLPLVEAKWTEAMCRDWSGNNDLLSPIYTTAGRGGCWFCHNQGTDQLRQLRHNYPEYWALMLKWDLDSPVTFHADGHTVHDYDRRFQMEDDHLIDPQARFMWSMLDEELNYLLF